jgi:hypothetical protein
MEEEVRRWRAQQSGGKRQEAGKEAERVNCKRVRGKGMEKEGQVRAVKGSKCPRKMRRHKGCYHVQNNIQDEKETVCYRSRLCSN